MQAIQTMPSFNRKSSLECCCEMGIKKSKCKKCFTVCDICSEKKFLRKISKRNCLKAKDSFEM
jgi:hypothetical protein